jgi:hypothetical protein
MVHFPLRFNILAESEKAEIFKKVEPYLTFLDFVKLERKGAYIEANY